MTHETGLEAIGLKRWIAVAALAVAVAAPALGASGELRLRIMNPTRTGGERFGAAMAAVGRNLLVGAPQSDGDEDRAGAAYLIDGRTGRVIRAFQNPEPQEDAQFGAALTAIGDRYAIGAPGPQTSNDFPGRVFFFETGGRGYLTKTSVSPTPGVVDNFGAVMAVMGGSLLVGDPFAGTASGDTGAIHRFDPAALNDLGARSLQLADARAGEAFGHALAIVGDRVLAGAYLSDRRGTNSGAAVLISWPSGSPQRILINPDAEDNAWFGYAVASGGDWFAVAAPRQDVQREGRESPDRDAGVVYVFDAATVELRHTIPNPGPQENDIFGSAMAGRGDWLAIGAPYDNTGSRGAGTVYVYNAATGERALTINNPTPAQNEHFGAALTWLGGEIAIGAPSDDAGAPGAGAVYVFGGPESDGRTPAPSPSRERR